MTQLLSVPERADEAEAAGAAAPPVPVKVLLVDDNRDSLMAMSSVLQGLGADVATAGSGADALHWLAHNEAAAIMLDVVMPELDGFETAKLIRLRPRSRRTPILFVTGEAKTERERGSGYRIGAVDYLLKPLDAEMVRAKIETFVELARQKQELQLAIAERDLAHEKQLQAETALRALVQQKAAVAEAGQLALQNIELAELFDRVLAIVARTLAVEASRIMEAQPDGKAVVMRAAFGWPRRLLGQATVPIENQTLAGLTLLSTKPVVVEDWATESRICPPAFLRERQIVSGMTVVIPCDTGSNGAGAYGVLAAETCSRRTFGQGEIEFLRTIASLLGLAITRAKVEASLSRSEYRFRSLITASSQIVWTAAADGLVTQDSPTWRAFTGQTLEQWLGRGWLDALHPEDRENALAAWSQAVKARSMYVTEYRLRRFDGAYRHVEVRGVPLLNGDGSLREWVGTCTDITVRKQIEEQLRANQNLLAQRAQALALSNKDLEQFAYVASHDLQEPLRMIAGYAELLARRYQGQLDDEADKFIHYIADGATRMQTLIVDLLTFSRITTRGKPFALTSAETALANVLANLQPTIQEKNAMVTHDPLPDVMADPTQLEQALQNLIANGLKFCTQTPQVHVRAEKRDHGWLFSVRDNGIGIAKQDFDKLFVIFQRLHSRAEYPGTGIGLAVCKKVVERHGGRIWVESEPGHGSTFFFTLPVNEEQMP